MTKMEGGVKELVGGQGRREGWRRAYVDGTKNFSLFSLLQNPGSEATSSKFPRLFPLAGLV